MIVSVAFVCPLNATGTPSVTFVALRNSSPIVRGTFVAVLSMIPTANVFGVTSPSSHVSVPFVVV